METTRTFHHEEEDEQVERVELAVAKLLRLGTVVSTLLVAAGLAMLLLQLPTTLGSTLITTGLIALVCTPLLRVAAALLIYLRVGDRTYSIISLTVLAVVFAGVLLGQAH
ncbi:MAG: DUF1634 domain-containing protein [Bacillota bacterium]